MDDGSFVTIPQILNIACQKDAATGLYFAYGSNMNLDQMRALCSKPVFVGVARLADHRLAFYGYSRTWDGGLETVVPAPGHEVWGVLFALGNTDWERLDSSQDARMDGSGMYFHSPVTVTDLESREHSARLYKKDAQGEPRNPSQEYLEHIVRGATANGLPPSYIEVLRAIGSSKASYKVPRPNADIAKAVGGSCTDCS
jgi:hypothetical protein